MRKFIYTVGIGAALITISAYYQLFLWHLIFPGNVDYKEKIDDFIKSL